MGNTTDQPDITTDRSYEAPSLIELGLVVEVTHGSASSDTADMKRYYN